MSRHNCGNYAWVMLCVASLLIAGLMTAAPALAASGNLIWARSYAGASGGLDDAYATCTDAAGNVYVTGTSYRSTTAKDILTIKYAPWGTVRWIRRYTSPGKRNDVGNDVAVDSGGNVYVTGFRTLTTGQCMLTLKYNSAGTLRWVTGYDGPGNGANYGNSVVVASNGQVYVTGMSWQGASHNLDILTFKYTAAGARIWSRLFNGSGSDEDYVNDMARDGSNNIYLAGMQWVTGENMDYLMLSYGPTGSLRWRRGITGAGHGYDSANSISAGGGYVAATGLVTAAGGNRNCATVRVSSNNVLQFSRTYDGGSAVEDYGSDVAVYQDQVFVAGITDTRVVTMKYGPLGAVVYRVVEDPSGRDNYSPSICVNGVGEAFTVASFDDPDTGDLAGIAVVKYSAGGVRQWTRLRATPSSCQAYDAALGPAGALYVAGIQWASDPWTNYTDYMLLKYAQ